MNFKKYRIISILICMTVLTASCGSPAQTQADIETAVAQTVQAQNSLTKVSALPTLTPAPTLQATSAPEAGPTNTPGAGAVVSSSNPGCVLSAALVAESPPDYTLLSPGEYFWKTWTFLNTGTCFWDRSYSLVFWDGERMGGLVSYPFPVEAGPGETIDIPIYLQAPVTEGTATGYWRFQTPWGEYFGVGPQGISFYAQINVSTNLEYEVTNVTYEIVRDPAVGCPLNVRFKIYATVTTNGPTEFDYFWDQSDGNESGVKRYEIEEAGTVTFRRDWLVSLNDNAVPRWMNLIITAPEYKDFGRAVFDHECLYD